MDKLEQAISRVEEFCPCPHSGQVQAPEEGRVGVDHQLFSPEYLFYHTRDQPDNYRWDLGGLDENFAHNLL